MFRKKIVHDVQWISIYGIDILCARINIIAGDDQLSEKKVDSPTVSEFIFFVDAIRLYCKANECRS